MTAKKFIPLLTAAATVMPSIALAHAPCPRIEKDLTICNAATIGICLAIMWLHGITKTSVAEVVTLALLALSCLTSICLVMASVLFFCRDFKGWLLFSLCGLIIVQVVITRYLIFHLFREPPDESKDTDAPGK